MNKLLTALTVAMLCLACTGIVGGADEGYTLVKSYVVREGEGYWHAAQYYYRQQDRYNDIRDFVDAIRRTNDYKALKPGDVITVIVEGKKQ